MVFPSSYIAQSVAAQNSMFSGFQSYAQQASYGAGFMGGGPMPPGMGAIPPPPPPVTLGAVARGYGGYGGGPTAGAYGEALAGRMVSMGHTGVGVAGAGLTALSAAGSLGLVSGGLGTAAAMMNPLSLGGSAAMAAYGAAGGGMMGLAAGGLVGGAAALPFYGAYKYATALGQNFSAGMQDQMSLNATLRQNFNFLGGQGAYGRGFSQQQMGQVGGMVASELRSNVFTSAGELNQVIAGGAQMGQFTGVRDVQEFSRKFKEMLTTLKTVQRELGGNLTEAMEFVNQSRQAGIFGTTSATRFAGTIRTVSAATGFDQGQLVQLASNGAQIARAVGGNGAQGAFGALKGISTVSTALQGGMISEEMLSAATGGRTGADAMTSFVSDMMMNSARYSRRAAGRYTIFGLANEQGTGIDEASAMAFAAGDIGVGELSRRAHRQVRGMGRAQAMNREGLLRAGLLEQGGMAGQIGYMRMLVGDRALDQGDDLTSLVMQRRLGMSRPQAEVMLSLMKNQGRIASQEAADAASSSREAQLRTDVRERRSMDAFTRHLSHSIEDATGMIAAKEMGRTFVTRISASAEKVLNDMLGISSDQMRTEGQAAMGRLRQMRATRQDMELLGGGPGIGSNFDIRRTGLLETGPSVLQRLQARGIDTSNMRSYSDVAGALSAAQAADAGILQNGADARDFSKLNRDVAGNTMRAIAARFSAGEDPDRMFRYMGVRGNATAAFLARQGITNDARADSMGRLMGRGGGQITAGMVGRDLLRGLGIAGIAAGAGAAGLGTPGGIALGVAGGAAFLSATGGFETFAAMRSKDDDILDFIAGGGHLKERLESDVAAARGAQSDQAGLARAEQRLARQGPGLGHQQRIADEYRSRIQRRALESAGLGANAAHKFAFGRGDMTVEQAEGMVEQLGQVSREDVAGLRENTDFMQRLRGITQGTTRQARQEALERLTTYVGRQESGKARNAMESVLLQARSNLEHYGVAGGELSALGQDERARQAAALAREEHAYSLQQMGRAGGGEIGNLMGEMGRALLLGNQKVSTDEDAQTGAERYLDLQNEYRETVIGQTDEQFREFGRNLMDLSAITNPQDRERIRAERRAQYMEAARMRTTATNLSGRGRRGAQGAYETAVGEMTGYSTGSFDFTIGGRRVAGRAAQAALQRALGGGRFKGSESVLEQFREHMGSQEGLGLSPEQTNTMMETLQGAMSRRDRRTGAFTAADQAKIDAFTQNPEIQQRMADASKERAKQALSSAEARDPVGKETNRLLGTIQQTLESRLKAPAEGDPAPPPGTTH